jgi:hypothetical protein
MTLTSADCQNSDRRLEHRLSLYLGAALYCDGSSTPARIRNLSHAGALVEAASAPQVGALVQLVRGSLIVHALVIWSVGGRCGLKFSGSVDVEHWRAAPKNNEQQRVDEVVRLVKAGAVPLPVGLHGEQSVSDDVERSSQSVVADLRRVKDLLDSLGEALADDDEILARHGAALQKLDISTQLIAAVQSIIANDFGEVDGEANLTSLRRSADQALLR